MKVKIDADLCTACELCVESAPDGFEMGEEVAEVKVNTVPADLEEDVRDAADSCPAEAILIED